MFENNCLTEAVLLYFLHLKHDEKVVFHKFRQDTKAVKLITDYIIEYKTAKAKSWTKVITVNGTVYEHCIENIKEKEELVFRISAENAIGVSLPAETQGVRLEKHASKYSLLDRRFH